MLFALIVLGAAVFLFQEVKRLCQNENEEVDKLKK